MAGGGARLIVPHGGMALHDMELELARLVNSTLPGLSAALVTAAAPDDLGMAAASRLELDANGRCPPQSSSSITNPGSRDTTKRVRWLVSLTKLMVTSTINTVIKELLERIRGRQLSQEEKKVCETELRYFERNWDGLTHASSWR